MSRIKNTDRTRMSAFERSRFLAAEAAAVGAVADRVIAGPNGGRASSQ